MKIEDVEKRIKELKKYAAKESINIEEELDLLEKKLSLKDEVTTAWSKVELARHLQRPSALDYCRMISDTFIELHGDRYYGDDPAMIGGIATIDGIPVTLIGNQKGSNLKENLRRNYGQSHPEGYRKALRLAHQAEKFGRPIVTFIDTQGAFPGLGSEERGIGEAIARNLKEFSLLRCPIICVIIGEGGSGGALGIGVGDKIFMLENSVYSVITPEGCASILLRDATKAKEVAGMLKITSQDLLRFKIINGIIPEPEGGAHTNPEETARNMKTVISNALRQLCGRNINHLVRYRTRKIQSVGMYQENHD